MDQTQEIKKRIDKRIGVLSENPRSGWQKEINLVSWNDKPPMIDVRDWDPEHVRCSKGIKLTDAEARALGRALMNYYRQ